MNHCTKCGNSINVEHKFCGKCGNEFGVNKKKSLMEEVREQQANSDSVIDKISFKQIGCFGLIFFVFLIMIGSCMGISDKKKYSPYDYDFNGKVDGNDVNEFVKWKSKQEGK
jgi:uncharacterized membrane protein YvbJ